MRSRSGRNTSLSRVRTARMPGSASMRAASARAIASVTFFSSVPLWPIAPGSWPPCPASTAITTSRSDAAGAGAACTGRGTMFESRRAAFEAFEWRGVSEWRDASMWRGCGSELQYDPQPTLWPAAGSHRLNDPARMRQMRAPREPRALQVDDHAAGVVQREQLEARRTAEVERECGRVPRRGEVGRPHFDSLDGRGSRRRGARTEDQTGESRAEESGHAAPGYARGRWKIYDYHRVLSFCCSIIYASGREISTGRSIHRPEHSTDPGAGRLPVGCRSEPGTAQQRSRVSLGDVPLGRHAQRDVYIRLGQDAGPALRPLHEPDVLRQREILQAQRLELLRRSQAVEIDMEDREAPERVGFEQRERRAAHRPRVAAGGEEAAGERRLPCSELPFEVEDARAVRQRRHGRRERGPDALHLLRRMRDARDQRFTHVCSSRATSPASRPRSPARAATSPLIACTSTATRAACQGSPHCASTPAVAPVSTSPIPAVAMPGLPRSHAPGMRPRAPTSVPAPLSTIVPP